MTPLVFGELKIDAVQTGGPGSPMDLYWRGRSLDRHPAHTLVPYVTGILQEAKKENAILRLHFETVDLINSSTITAVIQIIRAARGQQVRLEIVFDRTTEWQKLSFDALSVLQQGDDLFRLVGDGEK